MCCVHLQLTDSSAQIRSYVFDVVRASVPNINLDDVFTVSCSPAERPSQRCTVWKQSVAQRHPPDRHSGREGCGRRWRRWRRHCKTL